MQLPNEPRPGEPILADTLTKIIRYLRAITPRSSAKCRVSTTANGTTLEPLVSGAAASSESTHPFKIVMADKLKVTVAFGQVNGGAPQVQINGVDLSAGPELAIPDAAGTYHVYLEMTLNSANSSAFVAPGGLQIKAATELPGNTPTKYHQSLGLVLIEAVDDENTITKISQAVYNSIGYEKGCGSGHFVWAM